MFETLGGPEMAMKECRPDPKEMLDSVRDRIALINKGEELLEEFVKLPLHIQGQDSGKAFLMIFGQLKVKRMEAEHEEVRWLREIEEQSRM